MTRSIGVAVVFLALAAVSWAAQGVSFLSLPPGYVAGTVSLGTNNHAVALAPDPDDDNFIYVAGSFPTTRTIVRINLSTAARTTVFTCPTTVTIAGFAVLNATTIFVSDNWPHHRLFILRDNNPQNGRFNDPGECRELIRPILTNPGGDWTGSAVLALRSGSTRLRLPPNTVLFQSEDDGTTQAEVLAVINPTTNPAFQPPNAAYFSGFNYGGGLALDSKGRLVVASSFVPDTGKVWVCEDLNQNGVIGPGESNALFARASETTHPAGLSALAIDSADRGYVSIGWTDAAHSDIQTFRIPLDPLHQKASLATFATLNSPYVSAMIFSSPTRSFDPFVVGTGTMVLAASDPSYGNLDYLLTVRPKSPTGARRWRLY
jgi:hypothetical protein